jgi:hypothetical protein
MDAFDKFLKNVSYKFDKGYPDGPEDMAKLFEMANKLVEADEPKKLSKNDLIKLIQDLDLDDDQITKLYNRTKNFTTYRPIKSTLTSKDYNPIVLKKFSKEIQDLIEDLPKNEVDDFVKYLSDKEKQIDFPGNSKGNLFNTLAKTGVPDSVVKKVVYHTSQDEGKRGVGMGELGLSLIFKNVGSSKGKGDLSINGEEFEIKGEAATLGDKPSKLEGVIGPKLEPFGVTIGNKIEFNGQTYNKNAFAQLLADVYKATDKKDQLKTIIKDILVNDNGLGAEAVDSLFGSIDFSSPESIQTNISLMNFVRYAQKEGFNHFLAHDFGQGGKGNGEYIYVKGSPEEMASQLKSAGAKFEKLSPNNLRPRIGFGTTLVTEEDEE